MPGGKMPPFTAARMAAATHVLTTVNTYETVGYWQSSRGGLAKAGIGAGYAPIAPRLLLCSVH